MSILLVSLPLYLLGLWVAFWVIRLGVRYGVDDALRRQEDRSVAGPPGAAGRT